MVQIASMDPEATQNLPTQVYKDFYANRARSSFEPSDEASLEPGDSRYVDLEQNFSSGHQAGEHLQPSEDEDLQYGPDDLPLPQTPSMAGHKRDNHGNIISSSITPGSGLTGMFKKTANGTNVIPLSQVFNQTQQPSSPFPDGLRSDPVFDRPSPEIHCHQSSLSSVASSSVSTQESKERDFLSDVNEAYITMQDSQRRRDKKQSRRDTKYVNSSTKKKGQELDYDDYDYDEDDENSIERRIAKELQWSKIQEQSLRGLARLEQRPIPKYTKSRQTPPPLVDLVTPSTKASNQKLLSRNLHSLRAASVQNKLSTSAKGRRRSSVSPERLSSSQEPGQSTSRVEVSNTPPQSESMNSQLQLSECNGEVVPGTSITSSSPARFEHSKAPEERKQIHRKDMPVLDTFPTDTPDPAGAQPSTTSIIVNSLEHQRSAPSDSKGDSGFITALTHQSQSFSKRTESRTLGQFRTMGDIIADPSPPQASGPSLSECEALFNTDIEYNEAVNPSRKAREDEYGELQSHGMKDDRKSPSPPAQNQPMDVQSVSRINRIVVEKQNQLAFPIRVFALFADSKMAYYPATCLGKSGDSHFKIHFDDGNIIDVKEQHVRGLELLRGDLVRVDRPGLRKNVYVVQHMKDPSSQQVVEDEVSRKTDIYGYKTAVLALKSRTSLPGTHEEDQTIEIPVYNLYTTGGSMWNQFRVRPFQVLADEPAPNVEGQIPSTHTSRVHTPQIQHATVHGNSTNSELDGLFAGMAFVITYHETNEERKDLITQAVLKNGGQVIRKGFDELFEIHDNSVALTSIGAGLGFTALLADTHSRRPKHIQSLALNIPCLSGRWAIDSVAQCTLLPWNNYLIAAGESRLLDGAIVSRLFPDGTPSPNEYDVKFATFFGARRLILKDQDVTLVLGKKSDEKVRVFRFLCIVLGARSVKIETKKSKAEGEVSKSEKTVLKPIVLEDETIIQSLIVGKLIEENSEAVR